jgi:hypothetical protein
MNAATAVNRMIFQSSIFTLSIPFLFKLTDKSYVKCRI